MAALLLTAWVSSAQLDGALVKTLQGGVEVKEGAQTRILRLFDPVSPRQVITVAKGSRLELLFRGDGHREVITGPGTVLVEANRCRVVKGQPKVEKQQPVLGRTQIASSGTLDAVGGHVDKAVRSPIKPTVTLENTGKNGSVFRLRDSKADLERSWDLDRPLPKVNLTWSAERGWEGVPAGAVEMNQGELLLLEAGSHKVVHSFPLSARIPIESALAPGVPYRAVVLYQGAVNSIALIRRLNEAEGAAYQEFERLDWAQKRQRAEQLGLHHLAVQAVEERLHQQPEAELLQYVVDYYAYIAEWPQGMNYWTDWGQRHGLRVRSL